MATIFAEQALLADGWQRNVRMTLAGGRIATVETGKAAQPGDERHAIVLPGMPNLHSHAFQRGMAGLAEIRGPSSDSFWSWREVMYRFALSMTPEQVEAVAAQLYVEMLEAGFSRVGEFHYLHHDRDGSPYANIAEMAERIAAASVDTGIGLTLLPVFYAHSGFGGAPANDGQRRFINDTNRFARLFERCGEALKGINGAVLGLAPHSLRAATPDELAIVTALTSGPVHIHIAEQVKEVEDCVAWSGARPVEWLLSHADVDRRWCLIHATHMTEAETIAMARSGAVAGLCPITEANLGDGVFAAPLFVEHGGKYGVGSDSNVEIGSVRTQDARIFAAPRPSRPQCACHLRPVDRPRLVRCGTWRRRPGARRGHGGTWRRRCRRFRLARAHPPDACRQVGRRHSRCLDLRLGRKSRLCLGKWPQSRD